MFEEFMSQSNTELSKREQAIKTLLQESNSKNMEFSEKQRVCLNELMETVVVGLDTAVLNRDTQQGGYSGGGGGFRRSTGKLP